jgi:hypothetical protein
MPILRVCQHMSISIYLSAYIGLILRACEYVSDLILRSRVLTRRLEGWTQRRDSLPSFETHRFAMLLRMRSEINFATFRMKLIDIVSTQQICWRRDFEHTSDLILRACEYISHLILRSRALTRRLEGWTQRRDSLPSFETHRFAMLLRMRSEINFATFRMKPLDIVSNQQICGHRDFEQTSS